MLCNECQRLLPDYLTGLLSASEHEAVRGHSEDCAECRQRIEDHAVLFDPGRNKTAGEKIDFSNFAVHVNEKIDARARYATRRFLLPSLAVPAIAAVLTLVLLNPFGSSDNWTVGSKIVILDELVDQISDSQLSEFEYGSALAEDFSPNDAASSTVPESILDEIDTEITDVLLQDLSVSDLLSPDNGHLESVELLNLLPDEDVDALLAQLSETDFSID